MRKFVDQCRHADGVEPICKVMQVAPSGYWRLCGATAQSGIALCTSPARDLLSSEIERVWQANPRARGADKVWCKLRREGPDVARCTVERSMRKAGLRDLTYVSTWQGYVYVAFVIDVFARRTVSWRVSSSMGTDFVLDALEQASYAHQPERNALVHYSDRGSQYVSIKYSERLAEAGTEPFAGSKEDSDDNALAEAIDGLYKAELIHRRAPWKTREAVELATLEWVS